MAQSLKSQQGLVKLQHLPTKFKISVDEMSVFLCSLFNQIKNFDGMGKILVLCATIMPTHFFTKSPKNIRGVPLLCPEVITLAYIWCLLSTKVDI